MVPKRIAMITAAAIRFIRVNSCLSVMFFVVFNSIRKGLYYQVNSCTRIPNLEHNITDGLRREVHFMSETHQKKKKKKSKRLPCKQKK
jgi:hypothetical protein